MKSSQKIVIKLNDPHLPPTEETTSLKKSLKIEEDIRKAKLKEVQKMKEELEQKLALLNENASYLAGTSPRPKKEVTMNKEEKQKLNAELEQKKKEATEFIQKLKDEKKEWKKKKNDRDIELREKQRKESEELNKKLKEREEELLKKRKEDTMKTYQQSKQKREEEQKKIEEQKTKVGGLPPKGDYLYKKLEEKYNKEVLMPMLEDKKRLLAEKRNVYKPVSRSEIEEHVKKHEQLMVLKEEARTQEANNRKKQQDDANEALKKLKTPALERLSQEESKTKEENEKKKMENKVKREKMDNYGNLIKDICPVKASVL